MRITYTKNFYVSNLGEKDIRADTMTWNWNILSFLHLTKFGSFAAEHSQVIASQAYLFFKASFYRKKNSVFLSCFCSKHRRGFTYIKCIHGLRLLYCTEYTVFMAMSISISVGSNIIMCLISFLISIIVVQPFFFFFLQSTFGVIEI